MPEPNSGLLGRAVEALTLLVAVLTISHLVLVPHARCDIARGGGALARSHRLGVACSYPAAPLEGLVVAGGQPALELRGARGVEPGRHLPFLAAGVAMLGWGSEGLCCVVAGYGLLDPRGVVRRMGAARRDQAVSVGSSKPRILREGRYYEAGALRNLHNEVWPW